MKRLIILMLISFNVSAYTAQEYHNYYSSHEVRDLPENTYGDGSNRDGYQDFYAKQNNHLNGNEVIH